MYKKEIKELLVEILMTILIIFISIGIWNRICTMSRNNKQIAALYEDNKIAILNVDNYENKIVNLSNKDSISSSIIRVHNVSGTSNGIEFKLKISKDINQIINYLIIEINNNYYNLNEIIEKEDDNFYYINLNKDKYTKYETKTFNVKLLLIDECNFDNSYYNYEFITNTL